MRQLTDSEMNTLSQARREYTPYYTGYEIEELQGFGTGFTAGLDHAAEQIAALTAERDGLRAQISDLAALNAALLSFVNGQITRAELDKQINSTSTGEPK